MLIMIIKDDKQKVMQLEEVCKLYRVTPKQIFHAVNTGHRLKTMYFDFVDEEPPKENEND